MAADRQRLAAALAYEEERRRRMMESVPVIDDSAPTTEPRRSLRSDLENLSSGLGQAGVNILEGGKALLTDPIGTVKGTYETVKGVVRDPSLIADALRYTADKAMSGPLGAGEVIGEMVNPVRFRRTPVMQEIDVYHGSPHRFEEFDASKIGTGEGAQAYGHGIYFAENPNVAEGYRKTLGEQQNPYKANVAMSRMAALVDEFDGDVEKAADRFMQSVYETPKTKAKMRQNLIDEFQTYSPKGQLYKADLPDEMVDRMLDWDKPLSEQPESVRKAVQQINAEFSVPYAKLDEPLGFYVGKLGDAVGGHANASKLMSSYGIPGIKYADAGSRGQGGTGTRNFVVFPGEEKKVKILERNGEKLTAASALPSERLAVALKQYDPAMRKISESEFEALAKTGKIHTAKSSAQELESLRKGQSEVAEIRADADTVEGDELLEGLKQEGYAIEPNPIAFDSWIVGKNKEAISRLKNAKSPIDYGRAYGYSDADIAQFYVRRRGGDTKSAFREYLEDLLE